MPSSTALFSKHPEPGKVKTRLCPPLAPRLAAELALAMLDDLVERHRAAELVLAIAPAESRAWFEERYGLPVQIQQGAHLGERLARWFQEALAEHDHAVVIGSDVPLLPRATLAEAHERLAAGVDLVLAPDLGGGYGLVGLARPCPELFTDVPMSTAGMLHETVALAVRRGLTVESLPPVLDVDRADDLEALAQALDEREGLVPEVDLPRRTRALLPELLRAMRA